MEDKATMLIYDSRDNNKKNDTQIKIEIKKCTEILEELRMEHNKRQAWLDDNLSCTAYL
jgi:hypothetical protein